MDDEKEVSPHKISSCYKQTKTLNQFLCVISSSEDVLNIKIKKMQNYYSWNKYAVNDKKHHKLINLKMHMKWLERNKFHVKITG